MQVPICKPVAQQHSARAPDPTREPSRFVHRPKSPALLTKRRAPLLLHPPAQPAPQCAPPPVRAAWCHEARTQQRLGQTPCHHQKKKRKKKAITNIRQFGYYNSCKAAWFSTSSKETYIMVLVPGRVRRSLREEKTAKLPTAAAPGPLLQVCRLSMCINKHTNIYKYKRVHSCT